MFLEPFDKALTKPAAQHAANQCADQDRVTREERRLVDDEGADTEADGTSDQRAEQRPGREID